MLTEQDDDDYDDSKYSSEDMNLNQQSRNAHDAISLSEKSIEPDQAVSGHLANRNLGLGNINDREFIYLQDIVVTALKLMQVPYALGGFISHEIGEAMFMSNDLTLVMSNSKDGFLRQTNTTVKTILEKRFSKNAIAKAGQKGMGTSN